MRNSRIERRILEQRWNAQDSTFWASRRQNAKLRRNERVMRARANGMTYAKIGALFNLSGTRCRQICERSEKMRGFYAARPVFGRIMDPDGPTSSAEQVWGCEHQAAEATWVTSE